MGQHIETLFADGDEELIGHRGRRDAIGNRVRQRQVASAERLWGERRDIRPIARRQPNLGFDPPRAEHRNAHLAPRCLQLLIERL